MDVVSRNARMKVSDGDLLRAACAAFFDHANSEFTTFHEDCAMASMTYVREGNGLIFDFEGLVVGYVRRGPNCSKVIFDASGEFVGAIKWNGVVVAVTLPSELSGGHAWWTGTKLQHFDGDHDYRGFTIFRAEQIRCSKHAKLHGSNISNMNDEPSEIDSATSPRFG